MKRLLVAILLTLWAVPVSAQAITRLSSTPVSGTMTTNGDVITFPVPAGVGFGSIGVEARGTWTGTVEVQCAASTGGGSFVAINLAPRNSTALVTSFTANGQWSGSIAGCQRVRATATAVMTGTVTITLVGNFTSSLGTFAAATGQALCLAFGGTDKMCASATAVTSSVPIAQESTALGTTSTTGISLTNTTAATSGVTVQISPRLLWRGRAWDTSASQTVDFFAENLPASAATPTGTWKLGYSLNGAAATYPFTVTSSGQATATALAAAATPGGSGSIRANDYVSAANGFQINLVVADSGTAPTIASGGCTSPAITHSNGTVAFLITIGTSCTGVKTVTLTMPAAAHFWACSGANNTSDAQQITNYPAFRATSTTAVVLTSYDRVTGLQEDFTASDTYLVMCRAE